MRRRTKGGGHPVAQQRRQPGGAMGQVGAVGREPGPGEAAGAAPLLRGIYRRGGANGSRSKQPASHRPPARAGVCSEGRRRRRRRAGTLNSLARSQSYTSPAGCAPAICSRNAAGNVRPGRLPRRHRPPTGRGRPEGDGARSWAVAGPRWAEPSPAGPGRAEPSRAEAGRTRGGRSRSDTRRLPGGGAAPELCRGAAPKYAKEKCY